MFSSKSAKFFLLATTLLSISASCRWFKKPDTNANTNSAPIAAEDFPRAAPFQTREPENYQAEFVITSKIGGESFVSKIFSARNSANQIITFFSNENADYSILETDGKSFLINHKAQIFAEKPQFSQAAVSTEEKDETKNFISSLFLNEKENARFEKLETENNLTKYLVSFGENMASEIFVYFDEKLQMPVKQEFYSIRGDEKVLSYSLEIINFKSPAEESFFAISKAYKKVLPKEFNQAGKIKNLK